MHAQAAILVELSHTLSNRESDPKIAVAQIDRWQRDCIAKALFNIKKGLNSRGWFIGRIHSGEIWHVCLGQTLYFTQEMPGIDIRAEKRQILGCRQCELR